MRLANLQPTTDWKLIASRPVWETFEQRLPTRPYCADNPSDGVAIRRRDDALRKMHVQFNSPDTYGWILTDIDRPNAIDCYEDADYLPPNFLSINRDNGHAHAGWAVAVPITGEGSNGRQHPLDWHSKIERGITRRMGGDARYVGLLAKNPRHSRWATAWPSPLPFTMGQLSERLTPDEMLAPRRVELIAGTGRNVHVFDEVRAAAYKAVTQYRKEVGSADAWQVHLLNLAEQINSRFSAPLSKREVLGIAKSVARWTWKRYGVGQASAGFRRRQSTLAIIGGAKRAKLIRPSVELLRGIA